MNRLTLENASACQRVWQRRNVPESTGGTGLLGVVYGLQLRSFPGFLAECESEVALSCSMLKSTHSNLFQSRRQCRSRFLLCHLG